MTSDSSPADLEPISPELVLVADEEDARRARERLPELPWKAFEFRAPAPVAPPAPVEAPTPVEAPAVEEPRPVRRRSRRGVTVAFVALAGVAVAGYLTEAQWTSGRVRPTLATTTSSLAFVDSTTVSPTVSPTVASTISTIATVVPAAPATTAAAAPQPTATQTHPKPAPPPSLPTTTTTTRPAAA